METTKLILRKSVGHFFSIENVFKALNPLLGAELVELPHGSTGILNRLKNIYFLVKTQRGVIHISGHDHYLLWWPFKKAILTIHDIESLKRKTGLKRWLFKKLWFDIPIRKAAFITTISEHSKSEILGISEYITPIKVIHNPLSLPISYQYKEFDSACPRILHLGTKENKNLDRLISALEGICCQLVIIGKPTAIVKAKLEKVNVHHTIKVGLTNLQVIEEYYECDFVSFISTYEGFGLPIIEAQAAGRPVISSKVSSIPEVAGEGALLVNPFSVGEIRAGVLKMIEDKALRDSLIDKGLENLKRFSKENIAKQYSNLYEEVRLK